MNTQNTGFILIVDDNPTNLSVLSKALKEAGYQFRVAMDGKSAIEKVEIQQPELILLDIQMPGIDGFETCTRLKANPITHDIPIIFMTALVDTESKVKGLSLGAVDYITKPFEQEEVIARVQVHLKLRNLTKELEQKNIQLNNQNIQLQDLTENLEQRVAERTSAWQAAQIQLINTEKLATLGQMISGVAHELNNPISCIISNVQPAYENLNDLKTAIRFYQEGCLNLVPEFAQKLEDIDIEYALEDIFKILNSMQLSAKHIENISVSLRNFSRSDTNTKIDVNIHDGIDSTLIILGHRLKAVGARPAIQIIKQYGDIPKIECYPTQLNQVFMNIIANSIDALEEIQSKQTQILIKTELVENTVIIRIIDNGIGMSDEVKQKIFDQLYTTKQPGKGTGLGLAIARQIIVEKHAGNIEVNSVFGEGTEFIISLPILAP